MDRQKAKFRMDKMPSSELKDSNQAIVAAEQLLESMSEFLEVEAAEVGNMTQKRFFELDSVFQQLKREIGPADIERVSAYEVIAKGLRSKYRALKDTYTKSARFLLPLIAVASMSPHETLAEEARFGDRAAAVESLQKTGITPERESAYTPGVSEALYRSVTPIGYPGLWEFLSESSVNLVQGRDEMNMRRSVGDEQQEGSARLKDMPEREDAWRLYLGLPQEHNTFSISEYQPSSAKEDKYYYSINNWLPNFMAGKEKGDYPYIPLEKEPIKEIVRLCSLTKTNPEVQSLDKYTALLEEREALNVTISTMMETWKHDHGIDQNSKWSSDLWEQWQKDTQYQELLKRKNEIDVETRLLSSLEDMLHIPLGMDLKDGYVITDDDREHKVEDGETHGSYGVMGEFKISLGHDQKGDYISYYDSWNLEGSPEGESGLLGKPYEIYDRIYYDPVTYQEIH